VGDGLIFINIIMGVKDLDLFCYTLIIYVMIIYQNQLCY